MITNDTTGGERFIYRCLLKILCCFLTVGFPMAPDPKADDKTDMIQLVDSDLNDKGHNSPFQRPMEVKVSSELADNRIGGDYGSDHPGSEEGIYRLGLKWLRIGFWDSSLNWQEVESRPGEYSIPPERDAFVRDMVENGVTLVLCLSVGSGKNRLDSTKFKSDDDINRYANYVRFMVRHFKSFIRYYEIWNEPDTDTPWGGIAVEDFARLIKHVIPVIREEYPEAKIVAGATGGYWVSGFPGYGKFSRYTLDLDYLKTLLKSGIAPLIDVISWHPFYGHTPDDPYYQNYPQMVEELKALGAAEGFNGEYLVEEMLWRTERADEPQQSVSAIVSAKYLARAILTHLGLDVTASVSGMFPGECPHFVRRLCTVMAGAVPISLPLEIESDATNIRHYGFSLPNGDRLIALWTNGVAVDEDPGVRADLRLRGLSVNSVVGVDIRNETEHEILTSVQNGNLTIRGLLVKDYPIILRLLQ